MLFCCYFSSHVIVLVTLTIPEHGRNVYSTSRTHMRGILNNSPVQCLVVR
jgi:hypothetical protein